MLTHVSLSDFDHIPELTLIPMPINLEHEPPILKIHIPLMGNECETLLFDLDPTLELTPTLESRLDLNQLPKSVLVLVPFTLELKSIISPNHISLLNQGVEQYNFEKVYEDWSFNRDECHDRILHDSIHFGGYKNFNGL